MTDNHAAAAALAPRLTQGALPGELKGFGETEVAAAAAFVAATAARFVPASATAPARPAIAIEPLPGNEGRRLRLAVINDDMPFLVDSVAAAINAHGLAIDRIIHPVIAATRDADGTLTAIGTGPVRESMMYLEIERVAEDAARHLVADLAAALADVGAAVGDWSALEAAMARDADALPTGEGQALMHWFLDGHLTLLGHETWSADTGVDERLGIARNDHAVPILADVSRALAIDWLANNDAPLLLKSSLISSVHRAVPLDLVVLPRRKGGRVAGLSVHAGLWTSAALAAPAREVPVMRARLAALQDKYGFDPKGHAGKALTHALGALPHDVVAAFGTSALESLALTAMSLADRPRPALGLVTSALERHLFAFVWLPRDEVTTARRLAIGDMLAEAAGGGVLNWSIALDESGVALLRYTMDVRGSARRPDTDALEARIAAMVRGWAPAVEAALAQGGATDAPALAARFAGALPAGYRNAAAPEQAAADIARLARLGDAGAREVRLAQEGGRTTLHLYRRGGTLTLSDAVPVLENFGFRVIEEVATQLTDEARSSIHAFVVEADAALPVAATTLEGAIAAVLEGAAENDAFNRLIVDAGLVPRGVVWLRAWFRYLRQTGLPYGLTTVVDALGRSPAVALALIERFAAAHAPGGGGADLAGADAALETALAGVAAIDDDRILRAYRAMVTACLRTNAFVPAGEEALAFKLDSHLIPGLPAPVPWREVWVYSPRVEGIHLRAGPVARGGLRWSDRRDDFRTEILGLMKAQRVKNAVIVPTGAKGGFYPKQLPPATDRDAWMAEGTESYRTFIRALLSITDNIVDGAVTHPAGITLLDGPDPYFVVAADKGTATFSDVANALALERGFWLGDAFASGGSQGYDHKAMGITAKGAWLSVQRHFAERGVDTQADPITVVGCGDMSGDVFGNGMLLSRTIRLVAAFDHRHIFLDPDPDAATSYAERARLFALPRSSWADWSAPLSPGGGVHSRAAKSIALSPEAAAALGILPGEMEPAVVIAAILKAPADLLWFGGIGTYVKAAAENNVAVGDPANDRLRVNAEELRCVAIGEGANLGLTQAARIAFALRGGRVNTDFIDNSAGVDCSDNEVNIKIALNREMTQGRLAEADRNAMLASMTDDVAHLVLEDNRLQTLALSIAEGGGAAAVPSYLRLIDVFESRGRLDRAVEGLAGNEELSRRATEGTGLTRPELAVLLATAKLALQDAVETARLGLDPALRPDLHAAFPPAMRERFAAAIDTHRLRGEIVATKLANRIVNRLGMLHPFELADEEGASMADIAAMFVVAERLFDLDALWADIEAAAMPERARLALFEEVALATRSQIADLLRAASPGASPERTLELLRPGIRALERQTPELLLDEARAQGSRIAAALAVAGAPADLAARVVRLFEMDGAVGLADLGDRLGLDEAVVTRAFTRLGQALGLDWAQASAARIVVSDPWERLLLAGLARDFQQLRLDFLARIGEDHPGEAVDAWLAANAGRVGQFKALVDRARGAAQPGAAMLAQIAGQARVLLAR